MLSFISRWDKDSCQGDSGMDRSRARALLSEHTSSTRAEADKPKVKLKRPFSLPGGPLAMFEPTRKRWYLLGIVSFGRKCAGKGSPGIYTRVSHPRILAWLKQYY